MLYTEAIFDCAYTTDWQSSVFEQTLADLGFEAFVPDEDNKKLTAYIQSSLLDRDVLTELLEQTPFVRLASLQECPDQNWNACWEEEHPKFEVQVGEQVIQITPHCAFGAGYHETTSMILEHLAHYDVVWKNMQVLDNGCGTGILAIAAAKMGAQHVVAVDIDSKSVDSTIQNAQDNGVNIDVHLGDTPPSGDYDLILSNIHRNVLLAQLPLYAQYLRQDGQLWMSGFMEEDCNPLLQTAQQVGFGLLSVHQQNEWRMICLYKQ